MEFELPFKTAIFMRIWSLHPKYLDVKGLVALWRETLLAKKVLEGRTKGYKNHPQLARFKLADNPLQAINHYLRIIHNESVAREFHFDKKKFNPKAAAKKMDVTLGQMEYEFEHLKKKLAIRDESKLKGLLLLKEIEPHPLFKIIPGRVEDWEIVTEK